VRREVGKQGGLSFDEGESSGGLTKDSVGGICLKGKWLKAVQTNSAWGVLAERGGKNFMRCELGGKKSV